MLMASPWLVALTACRDDPAAVTEATSSVRLILARPSSSLRAIVATAIGALVLASGAAGGGRTTPGGWIVFASNLSPAATFLDGRVGAIRVHAFTADQRPRVDFSSGIGALSDLDPSLSPDGRLVAFVRGDPETYSSQLWVANEDGSNAHVLLTADPEESFSFFGSDDGPWFQPPAWSPDGRRLAIDVVSTASCRPNYTKCADWYTVIVDLDGHRLEQTGGLNATWSPNGRYLLLLSGFFSLEEANTWDLFVDRVGSDAHDWTVGKKRPGACWSGGSWSPDGSRLVLAEGACGGFEKRLHIIRTRDSSEVRTLPGCCGTWVPGHASTLAYVVSRKKHNTLVTVTRDGTRPEAIPGTDYAVWSPSGKRLAYARGRRGHFDIVVARGDGSSPHRVAQGPWSSSWVGAWSRDGKRIAFGTQRGQATSVAVIRASGGRVQTVQRDVEGGWDFVVGWTAEDRVLVERGVNGLYPNDLWVLREDGSGLRRLTTHLGDASHPAWSPDGSQIAFSRDIPAGRGRPEVLGVYDVPAAGGAARLVVGGPLGAYASHPAWSPDGKRLAVTHWTEGDQHDIFTVGIDGRNLRRVTSTGQAYAPAWSPDGKTIAFSNDGVMTAVSSEGGELRVFGGGDLNRYCFGGDWSPDGSTLAASCNNRLLAFQADGGIRELAADANSAPSWSPDGNWLVYQSGNGLAIVSIAGAASTRVDLHGAEARDPDWSSD